MGIQWLAPPGGTLKVKLATPPLLGRILLGRMLLICFWAPVEWKVRWRSRRRRRHMITPSKPSRLRRCRWDFRLRSLAISLLASVSITVLVEARYSVFEYTQTGIDCGDASAWQRDKVPGAAGGSRISGQLLFASLSITADRRHFSRREPYVTEQ